MKKIKLFFILILIVFGIMPVFAQYTGGSYDGYDMLGNYIISGTVTWRGQPLSGVKVTLSGSETGTFITNAKGTYVFIVDGGGNFVVTASDNLYSFSSQQYSDPNIQDDHINWNFTATRKTCVISNTVRLNSVPMSGVTITIMGGENGVYSSSKQTDNNGVCLFTIDQGYDYDIIPTMNNYSFIPQKASLQNLTRDTALSFDAILLRYNISGKVLLSGTGLAQVTMNLTGDTTSSMQTAGDGSYLFNVGAGGTYTVTPQKINYSFSPGNKIFSNISRDETQNFNVSLNQYTISGTIKVGNTPLDNVKVVISGDIQDSIVTTISGTYSFIANGGGNYKILPSRINYIFTPKDTSFNNLSKNEIADFSAILNIYTISGKIKNPDGSGIDGANATLSGGKDSTYRTDKTGNYSFSVVGGGNYTISASKQYYTFDIASRTFPSITGPVSQDFTGFIPLINLSSQKFDFGEVMRKKDSVQYLNISNIGTAVLNITDIRITGNQANSFELNPPFTAQTNLSPTNTNMIKILFKPRDTTATSVSYDANLQITHNDKNISNNTSNISLTGKGVYPIISLSRDTIPFITIQNGPLPPQQTFVVQNAGNGVLMCSAAYPGGIQIGFSTIPNILHNSTITVGISTTNLPPGKYYYSVIITDTFALPISKSIWVKYVVLSSTVPISQSYNYPVYNPNGLITISQSINPWYKETDYKLIGLPGNSNEAIISYLQGKQGTDWEVYLDNGNSSNYFEKYDGTSKFNLSTGKAFWVIHKGTININNKTANFPQLNSQMQVEIPLHPGWNLITNPLPIKLKWKSIVDSNKSATPIPPIYKYSNKLETSDDFEPFTGYLLDNTMNLSSLILPLSMMYQSQVSFDKKEENFKINAVLKTGEYLDNTLFFGVSRNLTGELKKNNFRRPRLICDVPKIYFNKPEWGSDYYSTDIRNEFSGCDFWEFEVQSYKNSSELNFNSISTIPDKFSAYLLDMERKRSIDIRKTDSYKFTSMNETSKFRVLIGTEQQVNDMIKEIFLPKEYNLSNNFPNPFNPRTIIEYSIPENSYVKLKIYNSLGSLVNVLVDGYCTPGIYSVEWEPKNIPSGVYYYRIETTKFNKVQRMIYLK